MPSGDPGVHELREGWQAAACAPDSRGGPDDLDGLSWLPARVPGTAAAVLCDAGRWRPGEPSDLDAEDWWFRIGFDADPAADGEQVELALGGIATVAEVYLNGELILESESMFAHHNVDVGSRLRGHNELAIRCRALGPLLRVKRKPRARWRTRLVHGGLRFYRTMLLGRAPGFAPGPAAVGPWRPVSIRRRVVWVDGLRLRTGLRGTDGVLDAHATVRTAAGPLPARIELELTGPSGTHRAPLEAVESDGGVTARGQLTVPAVECWWPHTHGEPALHDVRLLIGEGSGPASLPAGRVGFRALTAGPGPGHDVEADGLDLHINGTRVFARGAVWTPVDAVGLAPGPRELRRALEGARDAGMNMLRLAGTGCYEEAAFYDLCDELGMLVWQDFMFANLDYPIADAGFRAAVEREAGEVLDELAGRPSLAVLCGNSEVEQQVAMLGLDPALGRGELFGELLPGLVDSSGTDAVYLPSAPCGGDFPFRPGSGVANYFGVGGYRRPLDDARRAEVRFASECLALSNVPADAMVEGMGLDGAGVHHPRWKAGVPRDAGSGWDFEDVRDHYLEQLYGVRPGELRHYDHERYLELSRAVTGEVMAEVFGEWRRERSPCGGGLILWLRDLAPGAGWGLVDSTGEPKAALHHLRRILAPTAVWITDEGLGGLAVHVSHDPPQPLSARLRLSLYRDFEQRVDEHEHPIELPPHGSWEGDLEALLGRFVDVSWAYRFGPPAQDLVVASLERDGQLLSQAVRFPAGRPAGAEPAERLGLEATTGAGADGDILLTVRSRRLAYGVRIHAPGFTATDDAFCVEPGGARVVALRPHEPGAAFTGAALTALNLQGRVPLPAPAEAAR